MKKFICYNRTLNLFLSKSCSWLTELDYTCMFDTADDIVAVLKKWPAEAKWHVQVFELVSGFTVESLHSMKVEAVEK